MRLDGYIRVSRRGGREGDSYITKDVQREQIEGWARLRGVEIGEWFVDEDVSGKTMERPGLERILERIRLKGTDGVVVARVDRFSRAGVGEALRVIQEIDEAGGQLAAIDFGIDPTTPFGEFGLTILLGLARMQSRQIGDAWAIAQGKAITRGIHIGPTPVGYKRVRAARSTQPLQLDLDVAPFVHELFVRRASGATWAELARWFTDVVSPKRSERWTGAAVRHIIANRVYLGEAYHGDKLVNRDAHPPIVTPAEFREANRTGGVYHAPNGSWLLSGLVRCAGCRYMLRGHTNQKGVRTYGCRGSHSSAGECGEKAMTLAEPLEQWVVEQAFARHPGELYRQLEAASDLPAAEQAVAEQLAHVEELYELRTGARRPELAAKAIGEAEQELERLEAERDHLRLAQAPPEGTPGVFGLREWWAEHTSMEDRRGALAQMIDCIVIRAHGQKLRNAERRASVDERALIVWKGDGIDLGELPARGKYVDLASFDWNELSARVAAASDTAEVER